MIRIVGDINFADGYFDTGIGTGSLIRKGMNPFQYIDRQKDDFWIGNMECVCSEKSEKDGLAAKQFIISPKDLGHIPHLNLYGIANNHVMQHGESAYMEMQNYLRKENVAFVGSDSHRHHVFTHQGKSVGIIAFCLRPDNFTSTPLYWHLPELEEVRQELQSLSHCDYRIAYVHWGNEFINYPYIDQKQLAHFLIDSGINLVIGMHPHVLQGYEHYHEGLIFYSLGNFVFNMPWEPTKYSVIVNLDLGKDTPKVFYDYIYIGSDFCPAIVTKVPTPYNMEFLNGLITIREENEKYYRHVFDYNKQYQKSNRTQTLINFIKMSPKDSFGILTDFIKRKAHYNKKKTTV